MHRRLPSSRSFEGKTQFQLRLGQRLLKRVPRRRIRRAIEERPLSIAVGEPLDWYEYRWKPGAAEPLTEEPRMLGSFYGPALPPRPDPNRDYQVPPDECQSEP